jgi:hypothetical protein
MSGGEGEGGKPMRQWNVTGWVCDMETYTHANCALGKRKKYWRRRLESEEHSEEVGAGGGEAVRILPLCSRGGLHREWKGAMERPAAANGPLLAICAAAGPEILTPRHVALRCESRAARPTVSLISGAPCSVVCNSVVYYLQNELISGFFLV